MQRITQNRPHTVGVRPGYTDEDVWRSALGPSEPLFVCAALEPHLDAPEILPAGSMRSTKYGPRVSPAWRPLV